MRGATIGGTLLRRRVCDMLGPLAPQEIPRCARDFASRLGRRENGSSSIPSALTISFLMFEILRHPQVSMMRAILLRESRLCGPAFPLEKPRVRVFPFPNYMATENISSLLANVQRHASAWF